MVYNRQDFKVIRHAPIKGNPAGTTVYHLTCIQMPPRVASTNRRWVVYASFYKEPDHTTAYYAPLGDGCAVVGFEHREQALAFARVVFPDVPVEAVGWGSVWLITEIALTFRCAF